MRIIIAFLLVFVLSTVSYAQNNDAGVVITPSSTNVTTQQTITYTVEVYTTEPIVTVAMYHYDYADVVSITSDSDIQCHNNPSSSAVHCTFMQVEGNVSLTAVFYVNRSVNDMFPIEFLVKTLTTEHYEIVRVPVTMYTLYFPVVSKTTHLE